MSKDENHRNNGVDLTMVNFELRERFEQTQEQKPGDKEEAISFWRAIRIPVTSFFFTLSMKQHTTNHKYLKIFPIILQGVIEYSFSLFFTKCINYTFLYWLPRYLKDSSRYF